MARRYDGILRRRGCVEHRSLTNLSILKRSDDVRFFEVGDYSNKYRCCTQMKGLC